MPEPPPKEEMIKDRIRGLEGEIQACRNHTTSVLDPRIEAIKLLIKDDWINGVLQWEWGKAYLYGENGKISGPLELKEAQKEYHKLTGIPLFEGKLDWSRPGVFVMMEKVSHHTA